MKALVMKEYNSLSYEDVPDPKAGVNDVLIRIHACGICGSDVHGLDGSTGRRMPPIIMGHEASGVIEETGSNVEKYKKGDRVTFDSTVYCGKCHYCLHGLTSLCDSRLVLGVSCEDYKRDGAFAEYVAVPQYILYPIPDSVSFEKAAMVEPLSVAVHAVEITPKAINDTALVIGAGIIGLFTIQTLRAIGCGTIIAVDVDQTRLDKAVELGADIGLRADRDDVKADVLKHTGNRGADIAFEAVGNSETVNTGVKCTRKNGSLTLIGNFSPKVDLPLQDVVARQIRIYGSYANCGEYPACLDLLGREAVNADTLLSAVAPLAEGNDWFRRLYKNEEGLMKVVLKP